MTLINKLKELYPSGLILGDARAIVGQFGLIVNWINGDSSLTQEQLKNNEEVSIIRIIGNQIEVDVRNRYPHAIINPSLFKGIKYKVVKKND